MKKHNVFTEEINKMVLSSNDDKIIQSIDTIEIFAYGMSKDLLCKKEEIKCNNIKNNTKTFSFDYITRKDIKNMIRIGQKFLTIHREHP